MNNIRHMVMGLQSSGKTTFAAALWYLIDTGEVPTVLQKGLHNGDHTYLEQIAELWQSGYQMPRTLHYENQSISIKLSDPQTGRDINLQFVDLPGEGFERAFATRQLVEAIGTALEDASGLMIFVNAALPADNITILDVASITGEELEDTEDDQESTCAPDLTGDDQLPPFDASNTPRDVQIVDLLQSVQDAPISFRPSKIIVLISAWDKVADHREPNGWLCDRMPLLDQYLKNLQISYRIYGVSAQGGDLPEKTEIPQAALDRDRLLQLPKASERIEVVGHGAEPYDLTHPIRWLSGLEGA